MFPSFKSLRSLTHASVSTAVFGVSAIAAEAQTAPPAQSLSPVTVEAPRPRPIARAVRPTAVTVVARPRVVHRAKPVRVVARPVRVAGPPPAAAPVPVRGPSPIDVDPAGGGLTPAGLNLNKVAPSGSRLGLTPAETPASVEIVPGQVARDRGQRTVQEAVTQDATGFTNIGAPGNGGTSLQVRGFTGQGSTQQLFDGTRLYVASGTNTFPYDTWSAERIEVLRGPASVLYGEGSIGGIINVIPKKPTPFFTSEAFAAVGSDVSRRVGLGSGGPISDVLSYRVDVAGNAAKSWLNDNADYRNYDFATTLKFEPGADFRTTVTNDYSVNNPIRYFGTPLLRDPTVFNGGYLSPALRYVNYNVGNSLIKYQDNFTQVKSEWEPIAGLTFRNTAYRLTSERHYRDAEQYTFAPITGLVARSNYIEIYHGEDQIGDRFDVTGNMSIGTWKNKVLLGGEVNEIHFRHANNSPYPGASSTDLVNSFPLTFASPRPTALGFTTNAKTGALFAENQLKPTEWLSIIAGLRYDAPKVHREDYFAGTEFDKQFRYATWHAGVVVNPWPWLSLYTQYATGVDSVGNILTLSLSQSQFTLARGRQIEAGAKATAFDGRIEGTLAFYQIIKKDLLTSDPTNPTQTQQVGEQSSRGIEAAITAWVVPDVFRLDVNGAILRAKYDDFRQSFAGQIVNFRGFIPTNVPQQTANVWATWRFLPQWEARAGVQYVGKTYGDFLNYTVRSRYAVLNASIDYKVTDNVKFSLRGFNLTDALYVPTGSYVTQAIIGQPRRVELAATVRW